MHLTSVHPPFDVRIFHKECKSVARAGYEVTLIAGHDCDEIVDGVHLRGISRRSNRISRMIWSTWDVCCKALREDADLYHFHDPELIPVGLLMRLKKKHVIYDVHEDVQADVATKVYIPRPIRRPLAWFAGAIERLSSRCFSAIVPATPGIRRRFGFRPRDTVVISNYPLLDVNVCRAQRPWSERSASVVYAGLISKDRCIGSVVQAMGLLPLGVKATLNLAGAFSPPGYAQELASTPGWSRVKVLGAVDHPEVARFLSEARAGLCVYRPDANSLEGIPTKLFEYMQAGIPVIASDFPGFRAIVSTERCGLLVDPLDPASIARAIEYLLGHPEEAREMGQRGQEAVRKTFNWVSEESKLLALYAALLRSQPRGLLAAQGHLGSAHTELRET